MIAFTVDRIGLAAPGVPDWPSARAIFAENRPWPSAAANVHAQALGARERRRAPAIAHLAVAAAAEAVGSTDRAQDELPAVFACSDGDMDTLEHMCRSLAENEPWISPQRFHNSVHNAPAGYWSIATGRRGPNTSVSAGELNVGAGLVEMLAYLAAGHERAMLVVYDRVPPPALRQVSPVRGSFAAALACVRSGDAGGPRVSAHFESSGTVTRCREPEMEKLRAGNPAARLLPFLVAMTRNEPSDVVIERPNGVIRLAVGAAS